MALFTDGSGSLTVALLVVIAVVVTAMAARQGEVRSAVGRWRALLVAICVIGLTVLLANVAKVIVLLSNTGQFIADVSDNKVSNILALFPPALSVAGALLFAASRVRYTREPPSEGDTQPTLGADA